MLGGSSLRVEMDHALAFDMEQFYHMWLLSGDTCAFHLKCKLQLSLCIVSRRTTIDRSYRLYI